VPLSTERPNAATAANRCDVPERDVVRGYSTASSAPRQRPVKAGRLGRLGVRIAPGAHP